MNAITTKAVSPVAPSGRHSWKIVWGKLGVAALILAVMWEVLVLVIAGMTLVLIARLIVDVLRWMGGTIS